jgi:hypothetical protein
MLAISTRRRCLLIAFPSSFRGVPPEAFALT